MPRKKTPELDGDAIARAIEKELPGWHLAKTPGLDDAAIAEVAAQAMPGVTLGALRRKFLGEQADAVDSETGADDSNDEAEDYGQIDDQRTTVQIEPEKGGATKIADVLRGKVRIVQG